MARKQWLSVGELTMEGADNGTVTVLSKDASGNILRCSGTSVPSATAGYAKGCLFIKTDASGEGLYENSGSTTSCTFNLIGSVSAGEISLAEGNILVGNSSAVAAALSAKTDGRILVGNGTTVTSVAVSGDISLTNAGVTAIGAKKVTAGMTAIADGKILIGGSGGAGAEQTLTGDVTVTNAGVTAIGSGKVALGMLATGVTPSHVVKFGGITAAAEDTTGTITVTVTGALATDVAMATVSASTAAVYVVKAVCTSNTLTVTLSGAGGLATQINYLVLRAAA